MASIKVKFRPSTVAGREGTIFYQIIHERRPRQVLSDYHIFPSEWDEKRSMVASPISGERKDIILSIQTGIKWDIERLGRIARRLDSKGLAYTSDDVIDEFNRYKREYSCVASWEALSHA